MCRQGPVQPAPVETVDAEEREQAGEFVAVLAEPWDVLVVQEQYGIGYVGGPSFGDDPRRVRLGDLGLRPTERFTYHYDFTAGWCLDLRVEQIRTDLAAQKGQYCPVCTGGRRAGPPEDCGGVQAFLENTQPHHILTAAIRAAEILGMLLDDEVCTRFGEHRDELAGLLPLLGVDRFDRRTLNRALAAHAPAGTRAA